MKNTMTSPLLAAACLLATAPVFAQASGGLSLFAIGGMLVGLSLSAGWQRVVPLVVG